MKKMTDPERVRRALASAEASELAWALEYAQGKLAGAKDERLREYWGRVVGRIEEVGRKG